jgi:uncharacterized protein YcfJ
MKTMILILAFLMAGCSANPLILRDQVKSRVDPGSIQDAVQFEKDSAECAEYASKEISRAQDEAAVRAVLGAAIGFGIGALLGSSWGGGSWHQVGTVGAVSGGVGGIASTQNRTDVIIGACMGNRGYRLFW